MPKLRIPLQADIKNRNDTVVKDSIITNGFVEQTTSNKIYTVKRPGLGFRASGAGTANGTFIYNDVAYVWDSSVSNTNPLRFAILPGGSGLFGVLWSSSESYTISSDPIVYDDDSNPGHYITYYPAAPSTNVPPSVLTAPGNIYWSTTPFGATSYYGSYLSQNGATAKSKVAAAYIAYVAFESKKSCATKAIDTGLWLAFSGVGAGFHGANSILVQQYVDTSPFNCTNAPLNMGITSYGPVITL